ncbi:MAG: NAD(P)-binding protein [Rubrivivax sp.]|nr:NAD(P)-binding protein [Rubrivivax sp.]
MQQAQGRTQPEELDVVIVGAGLSGIGAAVHLQRDCPGNSSTLLESHAAMGGTWDLFRYPGVRSDSDMYTLGYTNASWTLKADLTAWLDGRKRPLWRRHARASTKRQGGLPEYPKHARSNPCSA